jgi:hypothetical protein
LSFDILEGVPTPYSGAGIWVDVAIILLLAVGIAVLCVQQVTKRAFLSEESKRFSTFAITAHVGSGLILFLGHCVGETWVGVALHAMYYLPLTVVAVIVWYFVYRKAKLTLEGKDAPTP